MIEVVCGHCKQRRAGVLRRLEHAVLQGVEVERPLVYLCEECGRVVATPQVTAGRVFAAREHERSAASATELRVPHEAEDLAFAVHAALGLRPSGDLFALPIALGLRSSGMKRRVVEKWRVLDDLDKDVRARPVLSTELLARIDGLREVWNAPDRSTVVRWLIVAGADALRLV